MSDTSSLAVMTGDLIGSTKVPDSNLNRAFAILSASAQELAAWTGGDTRMTRFRGDGWQMLIARPERALRAAIVLAARMRAPDSPLPTRISIGIAPVTSTGSHDLSDASGEAFKLSGQGLDRMAARNRTLDLNGPSVTHLHIGFITLAEAIMRGWTPEQAEAINLYLHPGAPTLARISSQLGITIQATSYRIRGGNGGDLRAALTLWEDNPTMNQTRHGRR